MNDHGPIGNEFAFISETGLYGTDAAHQSFVFAVPEPSAWALLILGFGGAGMMLRRQQRRAVPIPHLTPSAGPSGLAR